MGHHSVWRPQVLLGGRKWSPALAQCDERDAPRSQNQKKIRLAGVPGLGGTLPAYQIENIDNVSAPEQRNLRNPQLAGKLCAEFNQPGDRFPGSHKANVFAGDPLGNAVKSLARHHIVLLHDRI